MEDKFLKNRIENEQIEIPESIRPENIGKLLQSVVSEKVDDVNINNLDGNLDSNSNGNNDCKWKKMKRWSLALSAAAAIVLIFLAVKVSGVGGFGKGTLSYGEIYKKIEKTNERYNKYTTSVGVVEKIEFEAAMGTVTTDGAADFEYSANESMNEAGTSFVTDTEVGEKADFSDTNIQEIGVDEGDLIKTDGEYIYILKRTENNYDYKYNYIEGYGEKGNSYTLFIFKADGVETEKITQLYINGFEEYENFSLSEMYLDGNMLALIGEAWDYSRDNNDKEVTITMFYNLDDKANLQLVNTMKQSGSYVSSRKSDGFLYLISSFQELYGSDKENYNSYIPAYDGCLIEEEQIYCPDELEYCGYTVIGSVNFHNPTEYIDSESIMFREDNMYVSSNGIYFLSPIGSIDSDADKKKSGKGMSSLAKFSYDKGNIEYVTSVEVPGEADNQFSFNEYNGYLRLVTTSEKYEKFIDRRGESYYRHMGISNGLYIFDENLNMTGKVDDVAEGEFLKSSRFIGDKAYFVTFRNTDPLFVVDVSDPYNPVILDELKVSGFSEYLHPYGKDRLLGIGYEADIEYGSTECLKLSMFNVADSENISEENRMLLEGSYYSEALSNHKLILVEPEKNIFGFASVYDLYTSDYNYKTMYMYQLFAYDETEGFVELISCPFDSEWGAFYPRAIYIGEYLYIVDFECNMYIYSMKDYSYVGMVETDGVE